MLKLTVDFPPKQHIACGYMTDKSTSNLLIEPEAFELLTEPILAVNMDGTIHFANAFALGLLKGDRAEPSANKKVWELSNPLFGGGLISSDMHALALEHSPHRFRVNLNVPSAAIAAIEWTGVRTARAENPRIFYLGRLISAQEVAAERSNRISASIFSYSQSAVIVANSNGSIDQMSPAAKKLFKITDSIPKRLSDILPEINIDDERLFASNSADNGNTESVITNHFNGLKSNADRFPCEVVLGHVNLESKVQIAVFVHDMSYRERNVRKLIVDDGSLVRTDQNALLGQMASTIAHEIKQPLSAALAFIRASTKSLSNAGYTGKEIQIMESAGLQVTRAGDIIQNMQKMVQEDSSERTIEEINTLIEEATLFALMDTGDLSINTFFYLVDEAVFVSVDKIQIQQVVHNLVRNAVDAMVDAHPRRLNITTSVGDGTVSISIKDSGSGYNDALENLLFKPFTTTKINGMGLGLSICRRIISAHNGQISAQNHPKGGAVLTFSLPIQHVKNGLRDK